MRTGLSWRDGNCARLLENGEEFFARAFEAIDAAREEILLETFILFEDAVGRELHGRLAAAARRGVRVDVLVDGYGSPRFSPDFLAGLAEAGVRLRTFDPHRTLLGLRLHIFRRMHRKLLVVDGRVAFCGGINFSADHLDSFGPRSKQDYSVELAGPVAADIRAFVADGVASRADAGGHAPAAGGAQAALALRDNHRHSTGIERVYREAIRAARSEIVIANAYFFPGYGFLRDLRHAARRGVKVTLIVQGEPDMPIAMIAARSLYRDLLREGVCIHEYGRRPFHGKVALIDDDWATVGSSNLDPLSLSLNLEANVFIRDRDFNAELRARLERLRRRHCRTIEADGLPARAGWPLPGPLLYHVLRRFPAWAGLLPAHAQKVVVLAPCGDTSPPDGADDSRMADA
ncbi:cardiolipin synthase ClsB [Pseudoxanthomonas mexicana]|uniref:cardiolipin synthase ClsB n=1 Tax=Pseudoxanthomonas mexicana TaxID=128785 RepID=UPI00398A8167